MTPVSLPSLRYEPRLASPFPASALLPVRQLPVLSKRLCQRPEAVNISPQNCAQPEPTWRSKLTPDQAAALAIAREETGYASPVPSSRLQSVNASAGSLHSPPAGASAEATEDWKKARRKEQCRINQANYRKRKRQYEQKVAGEIQVLEQNIKQLEAHRASALQGGLQSPVKAIGDFYYAVGVDGEQQRVNVHNFRLADGSSPALQCLLDLQREEFDSVESLKLHWLWYREQFRVFQLSISSCERIELGEHVLIKITGQLELDIFYDAEHQGADCRGYGTVTCPILQQFEFEAGEQIVYRITSEVDLIGGITAAQDQSAPECTLSVLRAFSEGFTMSNRYNQL
ncbi:hypothetical protein PHYSODRAFT_340373 [Phytophthora sojae]|uniref:BZIP domain-containing protein n=1 Tax=Phytophthora sojae (strain P6497) TaxID=1094619 RepID=G5ABA1_PHYSP|nr:hypothetical protein PHYSODRAFT_340373 [Phytophthora sojae]EGZ07246.1 hypothetical protein PHYSODRAFT_340373 [Phytophthora sojae]|eukprot:XP_009536812.1 hypothetical protein PHYSODRAFT_340373 [Phytophthora sojae]